MRGQTTLQAEAATLSAGLAILKVLALRTERHDGIRRARTLPDGTNNACVLISGIVWIEKAFATGA
jgi:hypothetical protein